MRTHLLSLLFLMLAISALAQQQAELSNPSSADQPLPDQLWETEIGITTYRTNMTLVDGKIYIGSNGDKRAPGDDAKDGVHEIDGKTGKLLRTFGNLDGYSNADDKDVCGVYVDEKRVVFGNDGGELFCYNRKSGDINWKHQAEGAFEGVPAAADLNGDRVPDVVVAVKTVGDEDKGRVLAVSGKNGELIWQFTPPAKGLFMGSAALTDLNKDGVKDAIIGTGNVGGSHPKYNPEGGGHLYAVGGKSGEALWQFDTYSGIHSSPTVYVSDENEKVILFSESYSTVHLLDHNGHERIQANFSIPSGGITGLFASPLLGVDQHIVASSSWWGQDDVIYFAQLSSNNLETREFDDGHKVMTLKSDEQKYYAPTNARVSATPVYFESTSGDRFMMMATEGGDVISIELNENKFVKRKAPGPVEAAMFMGDVNDDGELEVIIATSTGKLHAYKMGLPAGGKRSLVHWPSFRGNRNNTGEASYTIDF